jgi:putative transposase
MARKKGQIYTAEQKAKIVLELLREEQTINQLATKHKVTTKSIQNWKRQFLENSFKAFEDEKTTQKHKKELDELKQENDELAKALGKTTIERDWAVKKLKSLDLSNKKNLVDSKLTTNISKTRQCQLIQFNRSTLYYKPKLMSLNNIQILNAIDEIYTNNPEYGYRFIYQQLIEDGFNIGINRVLKYMKILGIEAIYPTKRKVTTIKNSEHKIYPYLLKPYWEKTSKKTKKVKVDTPNEVWSGDITYIRVNGGFMYLCAIIDWHSKAILAYRLSNSMDATLATDVLEDALSKYPKPKIFNSDQGSQYTSNDHTKILQDHNIEISMNGKGRSIDNIMIERFFRTIKHNNIYINDYSTIRELREGVKDYIYKYNFKRFHSSLNYQKPMNVYLESVKMNA